MKQLFGTKKKIFITIAVVAALAFAAIVTSDSITSTVPLKWVIAVGVVVTVFFVLMLFSLIDTIFDIKADEKFRRNRDSATGIGNKEYFDNRFYRVLKERKNSNIMVAYISFESEDVFRIFGASVIERQIILASNVLRSNLSYEDILSRIGNGFIIAHLVEDESKAMDWTEDLLNKLNNTANCFSMPGKYGEIAGECVFSAGIYVLGKYDYDTDEIIFNAQQSYFQAVKYKVPLMLCDEALLASVEQKQRTLADARLGINEKQFELYLQFTVDAQTKKIMGAEALTRWRHPVRGLLQPSKFLEILEQVEIVKELDMYMFEHTCEQLQEWKKLGFEGYVACNFTRYTLEVQSFADEIKEIASRYDFDYSNLVIEITEDILETNTLDVSRNLIVCKEMGFAIALDDVGAGYTRFSDLRDYPINMLKIDRSLLLATKQEKGVALLRALISFGHELGMKILCEGVEQEHEYQLVRQLGCDLVQGYRFFLPMNAREATEYIIENKLNIEK